MGLQSRAADGGGECLPCVVNSTSLVHSLTIRTLTIRMNLQLRALQHALPQRSIRRNLNSTRLPGKLYLLGTASLIRSILDPDRDVALPTPGAVMANRREGREGCKSRCAGIVLYFASVESKSPPCLSENGETRTGHFCLFRFRALAWREQRSLPLNGRCRSAARHVRMAFVRPPSPQSPFHHLSGSAASRWFAGQTRRSDRC